MANNIKAGANCKVAKKAATFVSMGITSANTAVIYEVEGQIFRSYIPDAPGNSVTGTTVSDTKGYFFEAKQDMDLTEWFANPGGGGGGVNFDSPSSVTVLTYI